MVVYMLICIYKQTNSGKSWEISFLAYNGIGDNSGDFCSHSHSDGKEAWSLQSILPQIWPLWNKLIEFMRVTWIINTFYTFEIDKQIPFKYLICNSKEMLMKCVTARRKVGKISSSMEEKIALTATVNAPRAHTPSGSHLNWSIRASCTFQSPHRLPRLQHSGQGLLSLHSLWPAK